MNMRACLQMKSLKMKLLNRRKCAFNFLIYAIKVFLKDVVPTFIPTNGMYKHGRGLQDSPIIWYHDTILANTVLIC